MSKSAKISISLPSDILQRADRERHERGESRSEFIRRALETLFQEKRRLIAVQSYVDGYMAEPESAYEISSAEAAAKAAWEKETWD